MAQHAVAYFYLEDRFGVPQDRPRAAALFKQSAEQGLARAQLSYAYGLSEGYGVGMPHSLYPLLKGWFHREAMYWYLKAAEQDYSRAYFALGNVYERGDLVPRDLVQAYMWFTLDADRGSDISQTAQRNLVGSLTPEQIAAAEGLARNWTEKLAAQAPTTHE